MPRSTSTGVYTAPSNSFNPAVTNTVINTAAWNATQADYVTALAHAASTTRALYPTTAQVQDGALLWGGTAGGTADALTITLTPAITAYVAGQIFQFIAAFTNLTATPTVNINGAGAKTIKRQNGAAIQASDISANAVVQLAYNGTDFLLTGVTAGQASSLGVVLYSGRTSNTVFGASDRGYFVNITSGTFTQTFGAASALGSGWWIYLRNAGTGDITLDPNGAELIDGLATYVMYQGETRLIQCDGTTFTSLVLSPFYRVFTASGTFTQPPGYTAVGTRVISASGGGGSGRRGLAANPRGGGSGGGGAALARQIISGLTAGTGYAITIGAGGAGGAAQTVNTTDGNVGTAGGTSSFATLLYAYGGGGGQEGNGSNSQTGGGGGTGGAGSGGTGGNPKQTADMTSVNVGLNAVGGGGAGTIGAAITGGNAEYGGGSGGVNNAATTICTGGSSLYGGPGGGSGATLPSTNVAQTGRAGGVANSYTAGGGGAGGAATGANGTAGAAGANGFCGTGGGGGGSGTGVGGTGGAGGAPGGGGGGGAASVNGFDSGAGGAGARGEIQVWGVA